MFLGKNGTLDSYLVTFIEDRVIVNTNDCVLDDCELAEIAQNFSSCDILLAQFSYASWISNADMPELRRAAVAEKRDAISRQITYFKPKYVIPFASYIYFSHEENIK